MRLDIHHASRVAGEYRPHSRLIVCICLRGSSRQSIEHFFLTPWYKLHITKPLVVPCISKKLCRILEEVLQVNIADSSTLLD